MNYFSFRRLRPEVFLAVDGLPVLRGVHHEPRRDRRRPHVLPVRRGALRRGRRLHGRVHRGHVGGAAVLQEREKSIHIRNEVREIRQRKPC